MDMVGLDRMAAGMDVDVAVGVDNLRYVPGTRNWWSRTECRHCASVTNEAAELPQTSIQEKIAVLENTLACMGNDGRRVLEKVLERHQKNLNGPKNTAKHIKAKQNWMTGRPNASRPSWRRWGNSEQVCPQRAAAWKRMAEAT